MISLNPTVLALLIEVIAVLGLIGLAVLIFFIRRVAREKKALRKLVVDIKAAATEDRSNLSGVMENLGYEGATKETKVVEVDGRRRLLYQAFIDAVMKRDAKTVKNFHQRTESLVEGYQDLLAHANKTIDEIEKHTTQLLEPDPKNLVIERLMRDYRKVQHELLSTKKSMDNMLEEYSHMFTGSSNEGMDGEEVKKKLGVDDYKIRKEVMESNSVAAVKPKEATGISSIPVLPPGAEPEDGIPDIQAPSATSKFNQVYANDERTLTQETAKTRDGKS